MALYFEHLESRVALAADLATSSPAPTTTQNTGSEVPSEVAMPQPDSEIPDSDDAPTDDNSGNISPDDPTTTPDDVDNIPDDPESVTPVEAAIIYQALFNSSLSPTLLSGLTLPQAFDTTTLGSIPLTAVETSNSNLFASPSGDRLFNPLASNAYLWTLPMGIQDIYSPLRATTDLEFRAGRYREMADDFVTAPDLENSEEALAREAVFADIGAKEELFADDAIPGASPEEHTLDAHKTSTDHIDQSTVVSGEQPQGEEPVERDWLLALRKVADNVMRLALGART